MIHCKPKGLCSWNFFVDSDDHLASLDFNWLDEQGAITVDGIPFQVRKHGAFSGHWTLEDDRGSVASAYKPSAFTRTFELQAPEGNLLLSAESALGRSFRVEHSGEIVAMIRPAHAFTRRATIDTDERQWAFPTLCFAFWLVVLMWRRAAQSNS
jgi:hypothetical protein